MKAGDVVRLDFGVPEGSEPGFERPAVIVTADLVLESGPRTLHVVPLTGNTARRLPTEIAVDADGLDRPTVAQVHLCTVVARSRIRSSVGRVGAAELAQIRSLLADLLDIG